MSNNNIFTSYKSANLNSFQGQSENLSSKSSKTLHPKSPLSIRNQENIEPHDFNLLNNNSLSSKEKASSELLKNSPKEIHNKDDEEANIIKEEEDKKPMSIKEPPFNAIDEIMEPLRMEHDIAMEILYQEGDQEEEANVFKGKLLRDSFISQFEKGITEYVEEKGQISQEKKRKIFPRLNPKDYKFVEILGKGYHGAACKLRDKDHNEIVVKLYFKDRKEDFFNEACALSECRQGDVRGLEAALIYSNKEKDKNGIPPCFEMEKYYGLTLQAGFATLRDLKRYLIETDQKLNEPQLCDLVREVLVQYSGLMNLRYVHRDIKPDNIILLPSLRVKIIDFGFATKFNNLVDIKGGVGTMAYMSPDLLKKGSKDLITYAQAVAGDWYALGLSILEIAEPSLDLRRVNKTKEIKDALDKVKKRSRKIHKDICMLLNYEKLGNLPFKEPFDFNLEMMELFEDDDKDLYCRPEHLMETLQEFKVHLEKNLQKKEELGMNGSPLKEDDENFKELFGELREDFEEGGEENKTKKFRKEVEEKISNQIDLYIYPLISDFSSLRTNCMLTKMETVHALVDKISKERCDCCRQLRKSSKPPFVEREEGFLERFHEKKIEEAKKGEIEGTLEFWGHLNNVMVLKEALGFESEEEMNLKDEITQYLREVVQNAFEHEWFSDLKDEILGTYAGYYRIKTRAETYRTQGQGPLKARFDKDESQEIYLNIFMNVCRTKALRVMKMLVRESNIEFLEKLQRFSQIYDNQMCEWVGLKFEKKLDTFLVFLRFVNLFSEEPETFKQDGLIYLQEEAKAFSQQLKTFYEAFNSRDYLKCLHTLLEHELFYAMIGSYFIYWSAKGIDGNSSSYSQDGLFTENILLLMPFTDTIRVSFTGYSVETHPLENLLGSLEVFKMLQSCYKFIHRHCFEVKLNEKTQEFSGTFYSLDVAHFTPEFRHLIQTHIHTLDFVKEMYLVIESEKIVRMSLPRKEVSIPKEGSVIRIEEVPLELNLELLEVDILNSGLSPQIFKDFVNFLEVQRSLKNLHVSFLADSTSNKHLECLAESLGNLKELKEIKLNLINCHFLGEDDLKMVVEEFIKIENVKSVKIFAGGCPKITRVLELGEHVRMKVEPVILDPDLYEDRRWD